MSRKHTFADLQVAACISCGRSDRTLRNIPGAASPDLKICDHCWTKFGLSDLARESDRLLAEAEPDNSVRCLHCGDPMLLNPDGSFPLWCLSCEHDRQQIIRSAREAGAHG